MTVNLWHSVGTLLSMALLTSGGGTHQVLNTNKPGYTVAQVQADLGVLGFSPGPITGRLSESVWQSLDVYASTFGLKSSQNFSSQLSDFLNRMGTVPQSAHGPVIEAVEQDLKMLGIYQGPLRSRWSVRLADAVLTLQREMGLPGTGTLTSTTLTDLAHLAAVSVTAHHHWTYYAQPGDTLLELALAAHLSYSGFARANNAHGTELFVGQLVHWATNSAPGPKGHVKPVRQEPKPTAPPPPSASHGNGGGVLANLKPISDLILVNPNAAQATAIISAEQAVTDRIDVAVSGQWALMHPTLVKELAGLGNGLAIDGYSGVDLNLLPMWGVQQELSWARKVVTAETGTAPTFLFTLDDPSDMVVRVASETALIPIAADEIVTGTQTGPATKALAQALLNHSEETIATSAPVDWSALFQYLDQHQFVFETLRQIWAGQ